MLRLSKKRILILLGERGLNQKDLAVRMGVIPSNLSVLLNRRSVYPATAARIASALNVSVEDILED